MRYIIIILVLFAGAGAGAWYFAGNTPPPAIQILQPTNGVGQRGELIVDIDAKPEQLQRLDVTLEQGERKVLLFSLEQANSSVKLATLGDRIRLAGPVNKRAYPDLTAGSARIVVSAERPVLFDLRSISSTAAHDFAVHLSPPQLALQSTHHFINYGGSEMVVYRVSQDAVSGVRVGDKEYPGFPASGAGIQGAPTDLRVAFFAVLWDQDASTPVRLYARDDFGNESEASFDYRVISKKFRKSRIELDDRFFNKVVPAIGASTPELHLQNPSDLAGSFLQINRDLRQQNNATIADLARHTAPQILWQDAFKQLTNTAVEAGFADQRTYIYRGKEIDQQTHLGFDLASYAHAPVLAANRGKVLYAGWLGIYGNCVILDHGMGLQSLYAHLSSIAVQVDQDIAMEQELGRSGSTGLAAGDHLHFTMLLNGQPITPIDWWSPKWIEDRIVRKLREAESVSH